MEHRYLISICQHQESALKKKKRGPEKWLHASSHCFSRLGRQAEQQNENDTLMLQNHKRQHFPGICCLGRVSPPFHNESPETRGNGCGDIAHQKRVATQSRPSFLQEEARGNTRCCGEIIQLLLLSSNTRLLSFLPKSQPVILKVPVTTLIHLFLEPGDRESSYWATFIVQP